MNLIRLGNSDLEITPLGLGAWAIGGPGYKFSWGNQDDDQSLAALRHGIERGINWIDTAAVYGLGHSEEIVAKAVAEMTKKPYIFTKCGRVWNEEREIGKCLTAESVRKECEASLSRLKVDAIDLYQIHWPEPDDEFEEGWAEMSKLQEEGKVRWIGVSNCNVSQLERIRRIAPVTSLQPPYSLIRRDIEAETLGYCQTNGIGVIVYSPMASGLLTGKMTRERAANLPENDWRSKSPQFQEPGLTRNLEIVDRLTEVGQIHGKSPAETALAWTLAHPAVTAAIVGVRSPEQVDGVIGAADLHLSPEEVSTLQQMR